MPRLVEALNLRGNPFEHYVAELEPDIADYAVKPPYFEVIDGRAMNASSFILFGDRGAGKSATRLTIYKEPWRKKSSGQRVPFAVNMTDFSAVISGRALSGATESALVSEVAFLIIESLLAWLSSLEENDRDVYLQAMNDDEKRLCYDLVRDNYLNRPHQKRERSVREAMVLFNQALVAKSRLWIERRWDPISQLIATITDALSHRYLDTKADISKNVADVLATKIRHEVDSILLLRRLVDLVRIFDFSGIVILVDKVDETDATTNSVDRSAELIHPILARVQLLEIQDFSWICFLWNKVRGVFEGERFHVRLDKLGHASVTWEDKFFEQMLDLRVKFYSGNELTFAQLFEHGTDVKKLFGDLVSTSMRSPREIIRLMDVIVREHDVIHADAHQVILIDDTSIQTGIDTYVKDRISSIYGEDLLAKIFRLRQTVFTNKEVQLTFKLGPPTARNRIRSWESAGIVKLTGTRAAEGALGGKPSYEYTIIDARVERVMRRQLITYDEQAFGDDSALDDDATESETTPTL